MSTLSVRLSEEEDLLVRNYIKVNNFNLSDFVREALLDKIEEDLNLDEERILRARQLSHSEKASPHTEVWQRLGI